MTGNCVVAQDDGLSEVLTPQLSVDIDANISWTTAVYSQESIPCSLCSWSCHLLWAWGKCYLAYIIFCSINGLDKVYWLLQPRYVCYVAGDWYDCQFIWKSIASEIWSNFIFHHIHWESWEKRWGEFCRFHSQLNRWRYLEFGNLLSASLFAKMILFCFLWYWMLHL